VLQQALFQSIQPKTTRGSHEKQRPVPPQMIQALKGLILFDSENGWSKTVSRLSEHMAVHISSGTPARTRVHSKIIPRCIVVTKQDKGRYSVTDCQYKVKQKNRHCWEQAAEVKKEHLLSPLGVRNC